MPPEGIWRTAPVTKEMELVWPERETVPVGRLSVRWLRMWLLPLTLPPLKSIPPAPMLNVALGVAVPERLPPVQVNKPEGARLAEPERVPEVRCTVLMVGAELKLTLAPETAESPETL